jgi:hypothetical protein
MFPDIPYGNSGVVSLWDVLKFNAHKFVKIVSSDAFSQGVRKALAPDLNLNLLETTFIPQDVVQGIISGHGPLAEELRSSDLKLSAALVDDMISRLGFPVQNVTWSDYYHFGSELNKRIEHELKDRKFYQLKAEVSDLFETSEPFGANVALRFGGSIYDVCEASKCFACERYTATVFHLMRVLEGALKRFAEMLGINYEPNWDAYIKAVNAKVAVIDPKSSNDRAKREFMTKAAVLLQHVALAWRNKGLHVGSQYDSDQARLIFQSTKGFMEGFADGLSELEKKNVQW